MQFSSTALGPIRCYDKYYQLEEMEDQDSSTTELFLTADGGVEFGDTDGPIFTSAVGNWEVAPETNDFSMYITRSYKTGNDNTDVGEFSFESKYYLHKDSYLSELRVEFYSFGAWSHANFLCWMFLFLTNRIVALAPLTKPNISDSHFCG